LELKAHRAHAKRAGFIDSVAWRRKAENLVLKIRHISQALPTQVSSARAAQSSQQAQAIHLQHPKRLFLTSSPLVHNQEAAKLGNSDFKSRKNNQSQKIRHSSKTNYGNNMFKHVNKCEIVA